VDERDWGVDLGVTIMLGPPDGADVTRTLVQRLRQLSAAVTANRNGLLVRMTVRAREPNEALWHAQEVWDMVAAEAGIIEWRYSRVAATADRAINAELDSNDFPVLLSIAEIAELLGISGTRVRRIIVNREDFPEPVARLSACNVWTMSSVLAFVDRWPRRVGRPRKERPGDAKPRREPGGSSD
jgi:predicted DNA-binding transcriptional regulator AlpA